jgi:hypothetical protein
LFNAKTISLSNFHNSMLDFYSHGQFGKPLFWSFTKDNYICSYTENLNAIMPYWLVIHQTQSVEPCADAFACWKYEHLISSSLDHRRASNRFSYNASRIFVISTYFRQEFMLAVDHVLCNIFTRSLEYIFPSCMSMEENCWGTLGRWR